MVTRLIVGEHFAMYINIHHCCTLETNIILCLDYTSINFLKECSVREVSYVFKKESKKK